MSFATILNWLMADVAYWIAGIASGTIGHW